MERKKKRKRERERERKRKGHSFKSAFPRCLSVSSLQNATSRAHLRRLYAAVCPGISGRGRRLVRRPFSPSRWNSHGRVRRLLLRLQRRLQGRGIHHSRRRRELRTKVPAGVLAASGQPVRQGHPVHDRLCFSCLQRRRCPLLRRCCGRGSPEIPVCLPRNARKKKQRWKQHLGFAFIYLLSSCSTKLKSPSGGKSIQNPQPLHHTEHFSVYCQVLVNFLFSELIFWVCLDR